MDYDLRDQLRRSDYDASEAGLQPMNHYFVVVAAIRETIESESGSSS
jgi:hypothetical protein